MKVRISFIATVLALVSMLAMQACDTASDFDQPDTDYFLKYYGNTTASQKGVDMIVNDDGSIVIVGESETGGVRKIYFLKVDAMGKVVTEKYFSGPSEQVKGIEPLGNDEYIIAADSLAGPGNFDVKLIMINGAGVVLDSIRHKTANNDLIKSITVSSTGEIIVAGATFPTIDKSEFMIYRFLRGPLRLDNNWLFSVPNYNANVNVVAKVVETVPTTGEMPRFLAIAYSNSGLTEDQPPQETILPAYFGLTQNGDPDGFGGFSGSVNLGDTEINSGIAIRGADEGYFVTGATRGAGNTGLFICKMRKDLTFVPADNNSVEIYSKVNPSGANSISGIAGISSTFLPLGYLVVGNDVASSGNSNIWLSKIDYSGQIAWSARFGSEQGSDTAAAIAELPDGKILILGTVELGDNQRKLTLMKLNSKGQFLK
jgi:hypothetical protein